MTTYWAYQTNPTNGQKEWHLVEDWGYYRGKFLPMSLVELYKARGEKESKESIEPTLPRDQEERPV